MSSSIGHIARSSVKSLFARMNLQLVRIDAPFVDYQCYIPFEATIAGAREAGLTVGQYIEARHDQPGVARATLRQMQSLGVFSPPPGSVCEIGPGSGRYLEETLKLCIPSHYEIYETAPKWARWLLQEHNNLVSRPADGTTLSHTPSGSIDLVHAHKVLPGQSFLVTCKYLSEMARIVRAGGKAVFDVVTEKCMDTATLDKWLGSGCGYQHYPNVVPESYVIDLMHRYGLSCDGTFFQSMKPGTTQYMVMTKTHEPLAGEAPGPQ